MRYFTALVVQKRVLNEDNFLLFFRDADTAATAQAGQFAMVATDTSAVDPYPILMRPFSVFGVDEKESLFSILVKTVGAGTRRMAALVPGNRVRMVGPLGNQFCDHPDRLAVMIAGGVGIAPFYLLSQRLLARGLRPVLFYGARSRNDLVTLEDFQKLGIEVHATTEDASYGKKGLVTSALDAFLRDRRDCDMMACGPNPMLAALCEVARRHGAPLQVSVECYMGCGFGACFGCAVETVEGFRLACQYGPVFEAERLIWNRRSYV